MTPDQERLFWADYLTDLEGYDNVIVGQACERYRRSEDRFFPQTGQLRALCNEILRERASSNTAASSVARKLDRELAAENWRPPTEDEKRQVSELVQSVVKRLRTG